jgi:hypothetical protein
MSGNDWLEIQWLLGGSVVTHFAVGLVKYLLRIWWHFGLILAANWLEIM